MTKPDSLPRLYWPFLLGLAVIKMGIHFWADTRGYGFHRDELLYLALGQHLDWGYWSNPPLIGWISWFIQHTAGDSLGAVRLLPELASCALIFLAGLIARELGGGRTAQLLAGLGIVVAPAFLRAGGMLQPVIFDILAWTLACYFLLRILRSNAVADFRWFGLLFGLGMLNKYMVFFLLLGLVPALLLSRYRRLLWSRGALEAALIAVVIVLPNLWWQYHYHFPVVDHMRGLSNNQLVNVQRLNFLTDQLFMCATGVLLWLPGVVYCLQRRNEPKWVLGLLYVVVIFILVMLKGKSYYSLGLYPAMIAAGGAAWEHWTKRHQWMSWVIGLAIIAGMLPLFPYTLPVLKPEKMVRFGQKIVDKYGFEAPLRWEEGQLHPLPQDYADMLGWEELAGLVENAYKAADDQAHAIVYAENYGQAGAIQRFCPPNVPRPYSFSDTYRLWIPVNIDATALIYVNDELGEDVEALFAEIRLIGKIETPYAREQGTRVYLLQQPRTSFPEFWKARVGTAVAGFRGK